MQQYWSRLEPHQFVPVKTIAAAFQQTALAERNRKDLEAPQTHVPEGDDLDPLQRSKLVPWDPPPLLLILVSQGRLPLPRLPSMIPLRIQTSPREGGSNKFAG